MKMLASAVTPTSISFGPTPTSYGMTLHIHPTPENPGLLIGPDGHTANITSRDSFNLTIDADLTNHIAPGSWVDVQPPRSES